jgi:hypothetical protein
MFPQRTKQIWILLLVPLAVGLVGCPFSPGRDSGNGNGNGETQFPAPITVDILMDNLEKAYEEMNYDEYAKLLDPAFEFVFDPRDVGPETNDKDRWPKGDELDSTRNMFEKKPDREGRVAQSIRMVFDRGKQEVSPDNPEWKRVILTAFALELEAISNEDGQTWWLRTPSGYEVHLHFNLTEEVDPETNAPLWTIIRMEDKPPTTKNLIASKS